MFRATRNNENVNAVREKYLLSLGDFSLTLLSTSIDLRMEDISTKAGK